MKNTFKIFKILFITMLLFSCSNEKSESEDSQKDLSLGYWEFNLIDDASNNSSLSFFSGKKIKLINPLIMSVL